MEWIPPSEFACFCDGLDAALGHVVQKQMVVGGHQLPGVGAGAGREQGLFSLDHSSQVTSNLLLLPSELQLTVCAEGKTSLAGFSLTAGPHFSLARVSAVCCLKAGL